MGRHGKKKTFWEQEQQLVQRQVNIFASAGSKQAPSKVNTNAGPAWRHLPFVFVLRAKLKWPPRTNFLRERKTYVYRHNKCAAEIGLIVQLKSWKQTSTRAKKNIYLLASCPIEITWKKKCAHFHKFGNRARWSAQVELSNKSTGIISQSFKVQQYLFKIRQLRQKKFLQTVFLKGNYARVCPYGQDYLIKVCKVYRSWFMYKNYEYLQHLEWQSGAIHNKLETVFSGIFNSEWLKKTVMEDHVSGNIVLFTRF